MPTRRPCTILFQGSCAAECRDKFKFNAYYITTDMNICMHINPFMYEAMLLLSLANLNNFFMPCTFYFSSVLSAENMWKWKEIISNKKRGKCIHFPFLFTFYQPPSSPMKPWIYYHSANILPFYQVLNHGKNHGYDGRFHSYCECGKLQ